MMLASLSSSADRGQTSDLVVQFEAKKASCRSRNSRPRPCLPVCARTSVQAFLYRRHLTSCQSCGATLGVPASAPGIADAKHTAAMASGISVFKIIPSSASLRRDQARRAASRNATGRIRPPGVRCEERRGSGTEHEIRVPGGDRNGAGETPGDKAKREI